MEKIMEILKVWVQKVILYAQNVAIKKNIQKESHVDRRDVLIVVQ